MKKKDILFYIVGDGKLKAQIANRVKELELEDSVILTGFIENIDALIPKFDFLLFTSVLEGLGSTILDFFLAKKPVISTRCGGNEGIVIHKETGMLSDVGDFEDLAKNTLCLLDDSELKERITENAYQKVVHEFSIEELGKNTYTIYKKIKNNAT